MGKLPVVLGVVACAVFAGSAGAQEGAVPLYVSPSPLLQIDQQRQAVVDGIVGSWRETLAQRHGIAAADRETALRVSLMGLRADRLLAASLAGSYATVEALVAEGQAETSPAALRAMAKHLGEAGADLTYTPVNPCRILDTRVAGGALAANVVRQFVGFAANFTSQGGTASNCGMPNGVAAIAMNVYAVNPTNLGFIKVWAANGTEPGVSTVNYQVGITAIATGAIVPVEGSNSNAFKAKSPAGVDFIADVVGYFKAPGDATGLNILANGRRVMRYEYNAISPNVIGGSPANNVTAGVRGATIGGGGVPAGSTDPDYSSEAPNRVTDHYGTVGGGYANRAGDDAGTTANRPFATVSGGLGNNASGTTSTVGGGFLNNATSEGSTVGGGSLNAAGPWSVVAGGEFNSASGLHSAISGGFGNTASGMRSAISGGSTNVASGDYSMVAGGNANTASGEFSVVAGGSANIASSAYAFAAGHQVLADFEKCAVFGFFATGPANCKGIGHIVRVMANHGFTVDWGPATGNGGGAYWVEINDITPGRPINTYTNAYLSSGGTWVSSSDRNKKENFEAVDPREVLSKLLDLPVSRWNYIAEPGVARMGAMAQDFHARFGLGFDELTIAPLDQAGVTFAAIQGLNAKLEEREAALRDEVSAKDAEIAGLRREVAELRRAVDALRARKSTESGVAHGTR